MLARCIFLFAALALVPAALAQTPGPYLDTTFGDNGFAVVNAGDNDLLGLPVLGDDGQFYVGGCLVNANYDEASIRLLRFTEDGTPDASFGEDGTVTVDLYDGPDGDYDDECIRVLLRRPDGRLLALSSAVFGPGFSGGRATALQFLPDGTLDPAFGTDGVLVVEYETVFTYIAGGHLMDDGSLLAFVIFDLSVSGVGEEQAAFVKITPEGTLDASFGEGGIREVPGTHALGSLSVLANGGFQFNDRDPDTGEIVVRRFTPDFEPDATFGDGGIAPVPGVQFLNGHARLDDGRMIFGARFLAEGVWNAGFAALRPDGSVDADFGTNGLLELQTEGTDGGLAAVLPTPDGRLIGIGGLAQTAGGGSVGLIVIDEEGNVDTSLGDGGLILQSLGVGYQGSNGGRFLPDGTLLVSALTYSLSDYADHVLMRFDFDFEPVANAPSPATPDALTLDLYPNPTQDMASIAAELREATDGIVDVFDVLGRRVARLHEGTLAAGPHAFRWDARSVPSGVYVVRFTTPSGLATRQITVVR